MSLVECVERKFGKGTMKEYGSSILKKCNQKCLDRGNPNKRVKREATQGQEEKGQKEKGKEGKEN